MSAAGKPTPEELLVVDERIVAGGSVPGNSWLPALLSTVVDATSSWQLSVALRLAVFHA